MKCFGPIGILIGCLAFSGLPTSAAQGADARVAQAATGRKAAKGLKKQGDGLLRAGKRKEAEKVYQQAVKADATWYGSLEALGNLYFSSRRYDEAIEAFTKAVEVEPRYATGLYNIAFAYRKARNYAKAVEFYQKYIAKQSKDPDAYYGLAASCEAMGKKKEAMEGYLKYAEKETRPSERKYVVKAKEKAEKLKAELAAGKTAPKPVVTKPQPKPVVVTKPQPKPVVVTKPQPKPVVVTKPGKASNPKVAQLLAEGDAALEQGANARAIKAYFDASQLEPENADALYKLGLVYFRTGNSKAARFKWKKVLSIQPGHPGALQGMARLEGNAKVQPAAKPGAKPKAGSKVAKDDAQPAAKPVLGAKEKKRLAKLLAEADKHFKGKAFSQAISSYTKAAQLDPSNEEALFKLGVAYAMSGNYNVAIYKWQQVLKLNPANKAAKRNIERAKAKLLEQGKPMPKAPAPIKVEKAKPKARLEPKAKNSDAFAAQMDKAEKAKGRGDAKGVLEATGAALKIRKDADALQLKGEALVILKRYAQAKRTFSQAMVVDPKRAAPFYGLAEACRLAGDQDRARYYYKMYIRSKATDVNPKLVQRAQALISAK